MSVSSAMYAAITGLNAMGTAMSVVGNNIANVNTVGFKAARCNFQDLLSQNYHGGAGPQQIGRGVQIGSVSQIFSQGAFQNSSQDTDIAIAGEGFFMVRDIDDNVYYYTRAGAFLFDNDGRMVSPNGHVLQGYSFSTDTPPVESGTYDDIIINRIDEDARVTSTSTFIVNLDSRESSRYSGSLADAWDGSDSTTPIDARSYVYQTSIRVYDSEGGPHDLSIYFDPSDTLENVWEYIVTCDPAEDARTNTGTAAGSAFAGTSLAGLLQSGTITFDPEGHIRNITASNLTSFTPGAVNPAVTYTGWNSANGAVTVGGTYTASASGTYSLTLNSSAAAATYNIHWVNPSGSSGNAVFSGLGPHLIPDGQGVTFTIGAPGFPQDAGDQVSFTVTGQTAVWTPATLTADGVYSVLAAFQTDAGPPGHTPPAIPAANTPVSQAIELNFGARNTTGVTGDWINDSQSTTQYASPSSTLLQTQDGYTSGYLQKISIDTEGVISGTFSNGRQRALFRVGLALFRNPWGLQKVGNNLYSITQKARDWTFNKPGTGGTGDISPNSLEQSNVDLAEEFVDMIVQERGFQANSKVITTTDTMMAELINLKR
ncbi:MAG: flagellar hook protein FlgE [Thermodesulfobacteriota bacterium]